MKLPPAIYCLECGHTHRNCKCDNPPWMQLIEAADKIIRDDPSPAHYSRFKIQPIKFCIENGLDGFQFAIIKYVCRHDAKGDQDRDLQKAIHFLQMYRRYLRGEQNWELTPNG